MLLGACAAPAENVAAPAADLFPDRVARFERVETMPAEPGHHGSMAGYNRVGEGEFLAATVHIYPPHDPASLLPSLDRTADPATAAAADLARSETQVRRFYPQARVLRERPAFLVQDGAIKPGRSAEIAFEDMLEGTMQPISLTVFVFCCDRAGRVHEYRFRHAAGLEADLVIAEFMRALKW